MLNTTWYWEAVPLITPDYWQIEDEGMNGDLVSTKGSNPSLTFY